VDTPACFFVGNLYHLEEHHHAFLPFDQDTAKDDSFGITQAGNTTEYDSPLVRIKTTGVSSYSFSLLLLLSRRIQIYLPPLYGTMSACT